MSQPDAEKALSSLQRQMRARHAPGPGLFFRQLRLPDELVTAEATTLTLSRAADDALQAAIAAVHRDQRFEYMRERDVRNVVERFAMERWADRGADHVGAFARSHERPPTMRTCYLPVRLLPTSDTSLPDFDPVFLSDHDIGCVVATDVIGTAPDRMAARARITAEHALRRLRVALRAHYDIHGWQLKFTLGTTYSYGDRFSGWRAPADTAFGLELDRTLIDLARTQLVATVPSTPTTSIDKAANRALEWIERAQLAGDRLIALLFLFFALEAILGDRSDGQKAMPLAFRQALLDVDRSGGFSDPDPTWSLYEEVRSAAVHGSEPPPISDKTLSLFGWTVRQSLERYLELANEKDFKSRGKLLAYLRQHPQRDALVARLRASRSLQLAAFVPEE